MKTGSDLFFDSQDALDFERTALDEESARVEELEAKLRTAQTAEERDALVDQLEVLRPSGFWNERIWVTDDDLSWWPVSSRLEELIKKYAGE
jgi:hypothetical protein